MEVSYCDYWGSTPLVHRPWYINPGLPLVLNDFRCVFTALFGFSIAFSMVLYGFGCVVSRKNGGRKQDFIVVMLGSPMLPENQSFLNLDGGEVHGHVVQQL